MSPMYVVLNCLIYWSGGALLVAIYNRSTDIYNNKKTDPASYIVGLLWPLAVIISLPYYMIEFPAQYVAKYMNYRRALKKAKAVVNTNVNKVS